VGRHAGQLAVPGRQEQAVPGGPAGSSCRVLEAALQGRDRVTLDIDASVVHAKKKTARRTCRGKRGYAPMIGRIAETGQVVKSGLHKGSVPPAAKNREFFER